MIDLPLWSVSGVTSQYLVGLAALSVPRCGVTSKKKKSIFKDIIQIKVDHPPSHPIFDKLFFDKFYLGRAPTLPTEFLTET